MKKSRFPDSEILSILKQAENGVLVKELFREHGTIGWHSICSTAPKTSRTMPLAGSGNTITNDPIWNSEELLLNRSWP